jgi:parallel beta-helix repeat protein
MRKANLNIGLLVCVLMMALAGSAGAVTHTVDPNGSADFTGIQAAIDAANDYDEIEVAPGTYTEAINFDGKAIRIYTTDGPNDTTIDGTGNYHVVQCVNGEDANTILEGFTITGGDANGIDARNQGGGMYNRDSSPTVTNCTFTGNSAGYGGGMLNDSSSPTVTDCIFIDNTATDFGGGIENYDGGSPTVTNCLFIGNTAGHGGGMMNNGCSPTVTDCNFSGNSAGYGGGMYNTGSSPTVTNCTFTDNTATYYGGGMYNNNSSPTVINCTFSENSANEGGGMCAQGGSPRIINCNFRSNTARNNWGGGMWNFGGSPTVTNCTFSENSAGYAGGGIEIGGVCILSVTNCSFTGNSAGYGGGMSNGGNGWTVTNCTFIGNSAGYGGGMNTGRNSTVTNCTFISNSANNEGGGMWNSGSNSTVTNCILWGDTPNEIYNYYSTATVTYSNVQGGWPDANNTNIDADPCFVDADANDLRLLSDSPCVDIGNTSAVPPDTTDLDGDGDTTEPIPFDLNGDPRVWNDIVDMGALEYAELRVHNVTQNTSYIEIQRAINEANNGDEIEVAPGTYNEAIDFKGKAVRLYSSSGPAVTTIDAIGLSSSVVTCMSGEGPNTILEGFTITGGTGSLDDFGQLCGGGMRNENSSPTVTNCIFTSNSAEFGGGLFNYAGNAMVSDCTFTANTVSRWGAGLYNNNSSPTVTNCTFSGNEADQNGGGMYNREGSSPTVTNCIFTGNTSSAGGGMCNHSSSIAVTNCEFSGNSAGYGAGMWNYGSSPTLTNCTFSTNAGGSVGGMYNEAGSNPTVTNCILWGDTPNEIIDNASNTTVTYSDVQGGWGDPNDPNNTNIDADPCFVDGNNPDPNLWNLRLKPGSPCIDAGDTTAVPGGTWADIGGNPRVLDDPQISDTGVSLSSLTVDMGAYEFDCMAIAGDNNCDGVVDFKDIAILCNNWLAGTEPEL